MNAPDHTVPGLGRDDVNPPRAYVTVTATVVVLTLRGDDLVVLARRRPSDGGAGLMLPSACMGIGERLESAASRAVRDGAGVEASRLQRRPERIRIYDCVPEPGAVTVAYLAIAPSATSANTDTTWATVQDGLADALAVDHGVIVADALRRMKHLAQTTTAAAAFCGEVFTLTELRRVYEILWSTSVDPGNFTHAIKARSDSFVATGQRTRTTAKILVRLYRTGPATVLRSPLYVGLPT